MNEAHAPQHGGYYAVRLVQERTPQGVFWTASHPALEGCHAVARDPQEATMQLSNVCAEWIRQTLEAGGDVPPPSESLEYTLVLDPDHEPEDAIAARHALAFPPTAGTPAEDLGVSTVA